MYRPQTTWTSQGLAQECWTVSSGLTLWGPLEYNHHMHSDSASIQPKRVGLMQESLLLALEWRVVNMFVALIDSGQQLVLVALSCR